MPTQSYVVNITKPSQYRLVRKSDGAVVQVESGNPVSRYSSKTRTGNWDRPRPSFLEPSPYSLSHVVLRYASGLCVGDAGDGFLREFEGSFVTDPPSSEFPALEDERLLNEALIDALTRLKDQKFNAGAAIAEADGLARMGSDLMDGVRDVRDLFKRGWRDPKAFDKAYDRFLRRNAFDSWPSFAEKYGSSLSRADRLSTVPKTWLYYHFGYRPAAQDFQSLHEDWVRRHATPGANAFRGQVMGSAKMITKKEFEGENNYPKALNMIMKDRQSYRVFLSVQLKDAFHARLAQMGATNLPEAAWEGVPWSWLVDYFASVGQWLHVLDAGLGYEFGPTTRSFRRETTVDCGSFGFYGSMVPVKIQTTDQRMRWFSLDRKINQQLYPPMFDVLPRLRMKPLSLKQFANSLSALSSLF